MLEVDYLFDGGTPCDVERRRDGSIFCRPFSTVSGTQHFACGVRVSGDADEFPVKLTVAWPRRWRGEDVPVGFEPEIARRMTAPDSFVRVLHRCCVFLPRGGERWERLINVGVDEGSETASVVLSGPGVVATQRPYTWAEHRSLIGWAREQPACVVDEIGRSREGLPIHAVTIAGSDARAPTVWVQAYQHVTEYTGPIVIDAMARRLAAREASEAASRLTWQFVPAVDIGGLRYGVGYHVGPRSSACVRDRNPNRDWHEGTWPEVAAVRSFIEAELEAGRRYGLALDLHNGWDRAHTSGACYTVHPDSAGVDYVNRQRSFVDWMYDHTDHTEPGQYWQHDTAGRSFTSYFAQLTGALAHTVEFSRHLWWERASRSYRPIEPTDPERFVAQAVDAIGGYFDRSHV